MPRQRLTSSPLCSSCPFRAPAVPHPGSTDPTANLLAKRFYDGGFEDKMSKREAALILGVRESAAKERVLDRYRALMKINHPDRGGSPFLSYKVNEAKELLAKTAREEGPSKGHGKRHGHGHGHK